MTNRGNQRFLLYCAGLYHKMGYTVGLSRGKVLIEQFEPHDDLAWQRSRDLHVSDWDGISIILDGVVCVDFDTHDHNIRTILASNEELPDTWTEQTQRGWHYFYRLPHENAGQAYSCQVGYRSNLDLLVKNKARQRAYGGGNTQGPWWGHALISPTVNYVRTYPAEMMAKEQLPLAPRWITSALSRY